nr:MAG TPA: hypothetical protein [Caudoviricetes sp.]
MMTALEYLKTMQRMTQNCNVDCLDCPLSCRNNKTSKSCTKFIGACPEKAIEIVENRAKEHPVKTFFTDFKEKYPNALLDIDETPLCCPHDLGYTDKADEENCDWDCKSCWNREFKAD